VSVLQRFPPSHNTSRATTPNASGVGTPHFRLVLCPVPPQRVTRSLAHPTPAAQGSHLADLNFLGCVLVRALLAPLSPTCTGLISIQHPGASGKDRRKSRRTSRFLVQHSLHVDGVCAKTPRRQRQVNKNAIWIIRLRLKVGERGGHGRLWVVCEGTR
jgi:hypothetical protein